MKKEVLDKNYVFDTSAIFVYTKSEEGVDTVEEILCLSSRERCNLYMSFISLMEIYYVSWQQKGKDIARELVVLIKSLPIQIVESNERLILQAGYLKANHRLSVADAIIAATAIEKSAVLVHKDPELENLSGYIKILKLPYKTTNR